MDYKKYLKIEGVLFDVFYFTVLFLTCIFLPPFVKVALLTTRLAGTLLTVQASKTFRTFTSSNYLVTSSTVLTFA